MLLTSTFPVGAPCKVSRTFVPLLCKLAALIRWTKVYMPGTESCCVTLKSAAKANGRARAMLESADFRSGSWGSTAMTL